MNCRNVENNIIGYIENTLPMQTHKEIDLHMANCKDCKHLALQIKKTYSILDDANLQEPELFKAITDKLQRHHTTVVEFIPKHRIFYRIAASIIVIVGVSLGVFIGGNYSSTTYDEIQTISSQKGLPDYYTSVVNSMESESGLVSLYSNE